MSTEHYFDLWSKFGSDCSIKDTESCPYCLSNSLCPEYSSHGHSINGYLPGNRSCYVKCLECGLVTSIKRINDDDLHMIYDDYLSEKKVHKQMNITEHSEIKEGHMFYAIAEHLGAHSSKKPFKSVSDLGGKDGLFFNFLKHFKLINDSTNKLVCDFFVENEIKAELSVKGIGLIEGDIIDTINQVPLECQLYTIFEVIEHIGIEKLEILLQKMFKIMSSNNSILAISTPDFSSPACRLFSYIHQCPIQHIHLFSEKFLTNLFRKIGFEIVEKFWTMHSAMSTSFADYMICTSTSTFEEEIYSFFREALSTEESRASFRRILSNRSMGCEIVYFLRAKDRPHGIISK